MGERVSRGFENTADGDLWCEQGLFNIKASLRLFSFPLSQIVDECVSIKNTNASDVRSYPCQSVPSVVKILLKKLKDCGTDEGLILDERGDGGTEGTR